MSAALHHRGPDAQDVWIDAEAGVGLGHARLSIVDLSAAGAQPMVSSCGRFVVSYNGEAYNAAELRPELEAAGRKFRGHSDTEVIVEGFAVWGVQRTVERLERHVRDGGLGPRRAAADAGARPARHQAAVLDQAERPLPVRLRAQGVQGGAAMAWRIEPRRCRGADALQLRPGSDVHLCRRQQIAPGHAPGV